MKRIFRIFAVLTVAAASLLVSCFSDRPIDEDGLLISHRTRTSILGMDLLDQNSQTTLHAIPNIDLETKKENPFIDTLEYCVVRVIVNWRADIKKLWPVFTLADDCKLEPKVRELTDFTSPREYTVISGDRKHTKKYTVYVIRQDPDNPDDPNPVPDNPWHDYFEEIYAALP